MSAIWRMFSPVRGAILDHKMVNSEGGMDLDDGGVSQSPSDPKGFIGTLGGPIHWEEPLATDATTQPNQFSVPTGTVTLLLADIEGSVRLWESNPDDMRTAIARQDAFVSEAIGGHGGVRPREQGEGDSFVAAFARPSDAVACALTIQLAASGEEWPEGVELRLRIGVHTGEVQLRDEGNYVGQAVNRCARLREIAHGGQTLLSSATHDLVLDRLHDKITLVDLGRHRLRDLSRPEHVYELRHPDLPTGFPPLRSLETFAHNLPIQLTSFVGRQTEIGEVEGLLRDTRLLSLVGSGGSGKSRLALQVAAQVMDDYPDGVWLVDLAPIKDSGLVAKTVASSLSLGEQGPTKLTETISNWISTRKMLIILDNCEHLVSACAELTNQLLHSCPSLSILTTTREPLGVPGETSWRVPSLSLPKKTEPPPLIEALTQYEAVQLFIERALKVRPNFKVTNENAAWIAEVCYRLDGIPLAIELAAARTRALTPQEISDGLSDRFHLLTGGARTVVPRQQTLEASVDWSYDLLSESERTLLARLSVFAGGFTLDAAEAVCADGEIEEQEVLDILFDLVDKSMVVAEEEGPASRFRLLETVRQYAARRLYEVGEEEETRTLHRDYFADLVSKLESDQSEAETTRQFEAELDNIRAALQWSKDRREDKKLLELVSSITRIWQSRGYYREARGWLELVLDQDHPQTWQRARVQVALGWVYWLTGDHAKIPELLGGLETLRESDDPRAKATIPYGLVLDAWVTGLTPGPESRRRAMLLHEEAVKEARNSGNMAVLLFALQYLGRQYENEREPDSARGPYEEAVAIAREIDAPATVAVAGLARILESEGDLSSAIRLTERAVETARRTRDVNGLGQALFGLGWLYLSLGDFKSMRESGEELLRLVQGSPMWENNALLLLANAAAGEGDVDQAAALWGELAHRAESSGRPTFFQLGWVKRLTGDIKSALNHFEEALASAREPASRFNLGPVLRSLSGLHRAVGDVERGEALAHESLAYHAAARARGGVGLALREIAACAADLGSYVEAARLFGAEESLMEKSGGVRGRWGDTYDKDVARLRDSMDPAELEAAWAEGKAMSMEEAVAYAQRGRGERKRPTTGWPSLTPTELDVAQLVAEGLTNPEIGKRMFVSSRTVQTHVKHIFAKLGISKRAELAAQWTRRQSKEGLPT